MSIFPTFSSARTSALATPRFVENEPLSHALMIVKAQQDLKRETKVLTNSPKVDYQMRSSQVYEPDYVETPLALKEVEMPA